jgi:hypothetical protein
MRAQPWRNTPSSRSPRYFNQIFRRSGLAQISSIEVLVGLALAISGCAPSALSAARHNIAQGQYAAAHQQLVDLSSHNANLSPAERREVKDDFCLTEFMIGRPQYSLHEQRRACSDATAEPGSQSGQMLARVEDETRKDLVARITAALDSGDLATAEEAATEYTAMPGADQALVAEWSKKMWSLAATEGESRVPTRKRAISAAIADVARDYPEMKEMSDAKFRHWIGKTATAAGKPLVHKTVVGRDTLKLWVAHDQLGAAVLNLDKFVTINDALAARCGCDARTEVGVLETGFPLCVVRLDPETRRSEVLVLPRRTSLPSGMVSAER